MPLSPQQRISNAILNQIGRLQPKKSMTIQSHVIFDLGLSREHVKQWLETDPSLKVSNVVGEMGGLKVERLVTFGGLNDSKPSPT